MLRTWNTRTNMIFKLRVLFTTDNPRFFSFFFPFSRSVIFFLNWRIAKLSVMFSFSFSRRTKATQKPVRAGSAGRRKHLRRRHTCLIPPSSSSVNASLVSVPTLNSRPITLLRSRSWTSLPPVSTPIRPRRCSPPVTRSPSIRWIFDSRHKK